VADLAVVALGLDTTGMKRGEQEVARTTSNITKQFDSMSKAASQVGSALSGVGGPVGRVASSLQNLVGQSSQLTSALGLAGTAIGALGTAAAVGAAGVLALGAAMVSAAIDGGKMADNLADMASVTGVSVKTLSDLSAGMILSGSSAESANSAISRFANNLGQAASGEAPRLEKAMRALGAVDFSDVDNSLKRVLGTLAKSENITQANAVAYQLAGREGARLVSVYREMNDANSETNKQLARFGILLGTDVLTNAAKVGNQLDILALAFEHLKIKIASDMSEAIVQFGVTFLETLKNLTPAILAFARLASTVLKPIAGIFEIKGLPSARAPAGQTVTVGGQEVEVMEGKFPPGFAKGFITDTTGKALTEALKALLGPEKEKAAAAKKTRTPIEGFTPEFLLGAATSATQQAAEVAEGFARGEAEARKVRREDFGEDLSRTLDRLALLSEAKGVPLALPLAPPGFRFGATEPIGPAGKTIRTEAQAVLDEQFNAIFDDFLVSIITARQTLAGAFAGLALGIADTLAIEFTKSFRDAFIKPLTEGLTELLNGALKSIFGGIGSGGGLKGVFGGILKGIGTIFGGLFASGGVLPANQIGVVGERGPELIFSGARPLTVAPTGIGGGNAYTFNFAITTPSGQIDRRSQDQMAASVLSAVRRAQRNEGAR
jgi:hypothetical protein